MKFMSSIGLVVLMKTLTILMGRQNERHSIWLKS